MKLMIMSFLVASQAFAGNFSGSWSGKGLAEDAQGSADCTINLEIKETNMTVQILKESISCAGGASTSESSVSYEIGIDSLNLNGEYVGAYFNEFMSIRKELGPIVGSYVKLYDFKDGKITFTRKIFSIRFNLRSSLTGVLVKK